MSYLSSHTSYTNYICLTDYRKLLTQEMTKIHWMFSLIQNSEISSLNEKNGINKSAFIWNNDLYPPNLQYHFVILPTIYIQDLSWLDNIYCTSYFHFHLNLHNKYVSQLGGVKPAFWSSKKYKSEFCFLSYNGFHPNSLWSPTLFFSVFDNIFGTIV